MRSFETAGKSFSRLLIVFLAGTTAAAAAEKPFRFNLFANYNHQWLTANAESLWNPNNMIALPGRESRLYLNPEGRLALASVRMRISPFLTVDRQGKTETGWREGYATLPLGKMEFTAGKVLMKLGTGYMFTPLSVITPAKALADPEDMLRGQEGVWMVKADYYRESWSLSAIVFKKDNWRNAALFAYTSWKGVDLYGILYYPEYRKVEGGLAAAATVGQSLEIHAEAMLRRRSPVLFHRVYEAADPQVSYNEWPLFQPEDRVYPEILVGSTLTLKSGLNLIVEYSHRDWGLTKSAWENLKSHFLFNLNKGGDPFASPNIGADIQVATAGSRGLMRDYVFARVAKRLGKTDLSAVSFVNLADFSQMNLVDLDFELADGVAFFIRPIFFSGKKGSEFANSFYSSMIQIGFTAVL